MRLFLAQLIIWVIVNLALDWYIYCNLKRRLPAHPFWKWLQAATSLLFLGVAVTAMSLPVHSGNDATMLAINWLLYTYISIYIPKYIYFIFDIISLIPCLWKSHRIKWLGRIGAIVAFIVFIAFWWAALINRYNIDVREVEVDIPALPARFDGYRIVQFSDFHVGTYGADTTFVAEVVSIINNLHPDAVFFTGDIVNRQSDELLPFVKTLSEISVGGDSVIAILGNHDYGDYYSWPSPQAKAANMELLYKSFDDMGWKLLRNSTYWLVRGTDSIAVIGVENIGDPPFPVYGSLEKAYPDVSDDKTKILLTHNPAHWTDSISDQAAENIALTLSGHTHAMQMTFFGWSPAVWRYPTWGGLYHDADSSHQLYVNIGVGTVGLPMRLGATPEITLITLKCRR